VSARHGVYFVPADGSALARFGQGVLGRDATGVPVAPLAGLPEVPPEWTARPARYGFHATLKAPFRLAADTDEASLVEACDALARSREACPLDGLRVRRQGSFVALVQPSSDAAIDALAADCVVGLEPFRAPLSAADLERRGADALAPEARARLERWGYPHVLEGFRFHMTLSASLPPGASLDRWLEALARRFDECVPETPVLDRIALCREHTPGAPFVRIAEFPLRG